MPETKKDHWSIEAQIHYPMIGEVRLSPNGEKIVYTVREPLLNEEKSSFIYHLYLADVETGKKRQLTFGDGSETSPRWSPCGCYLAFVSTRREKSNLYAMRTDGGESWAITDNDKYGVTELEWAPHGESIAFLMPEPPTEEKEMRIKAKDDAYLWHEEFDYQHIYTVNFSVGPRKLPIVEQVTKGEFHVIAIDWLPDGGTIAFKHQPSPLADVWPDSRLALVPSKPEEPVEKTGLKDLGLLASWSGGVKASPDGKWIACSAGDLPTGWAFSNRIVLYSTEGKKKKPLARTPDSQSYLIEWSPDSESVYVYESESVNTQIWELPTSGSDGRKVTSAELRRKTFDVGVSGLIAYAAEDFGSMNSLHILHPGDGSEKEVTKPDIPIAWPTAKIPRAEVINWKSRDGTDVEGIVYFPLGYKKGKKYPLVVEVHGGPTGVYGRTFVPDPMRYGDTVALAQEGFVMLRANPRGSSGYGKEFRFANYDDWGGGDYEDIMSGVDHLIEQGIVDPDRMGILGWSYGGYMTSWTITQTDRFKAACVGAGVTNLMSFNGTSDIPTFIPDYFHGEYWDNLELYITHSAMFNVKDVKTPTLIQHGEKDARVPVSQGQELYNALQRQGVPTRMVIYPRQPHGIGEPRLMMDVRKRSVRWFLRWILGKEMQ
jgi:dipeptidyl aminopeptidase/acylaminoacyl peptidase